MNKAAQELLSKIMTAISAVNGKPLLMEQIVYLTQKDNKDLHEARIRKAAYALASGGYLVKERAPKMEGRGPLMQYAVNPNKKFASDKIVKAAEKNKPPLHGKKTLIREPSRSAAHKAFVSKTRRAAEIETVSNDTFENVCRIAGLDPGRVRAAALRKL